MGIIRETSAAVVDKHDSTVRNAARVREKSYREAIEKTGIDRDIDFEGGLDEALIHNLGREAFEMANFTRFEDFFEDIERAEDGGIPVLHIGDKAVDLADPAFDQTQYSRGRQRSTSLAIVESLSPAIFSTIESLEGVVAYQDTGEPSTIIQRVLGIKAATATLYKDITWLREADLPSTGAAISDTLPLRVERLAGGNGKLLAYADGSYFQSTTLQIVDRGQTLRVGWDKITETILDLATRGKFEADPRVARPAASDLAASLGALTEKLDLGDESIARVQEIQEQLAD